MPHPEQPPQREPSEHFLEIGAKAAAVVPIVFGLGCVGRWSGKVDKRRQKRKRRRRKRMRWTIIEKLNQRTEIPLFGRGVSMRCTTRMGKLAGANLVKIGSDHVFIPDM
jgi:hypothetical protein